MKLHELMIQFFIIVSLLILNISLMFQAEKLFAIKSDIDNEILYKTYLVSGMKKICLDKTYINKLNKTWEEIKDQWEKQCVSIFLLDYLNLEKTENGYIERWKKDGNEYVYFLEELE